MSDADLVEVHDLIKEYDEGETVARVWLMHRADESPGPAVRRFREALIDRVGPGGR